MRTTFEVCTCTLFRLRVIRTSSEIYPFRKVADFALNIRTHSTNYTFSRVAVENRLWLLLQPTIIPFQCILIFVFLSCFDSVRLSLFSRGFSLFRAPFMQNYQITVPVVINCTTHNVHMTLVFHARFTILYLTLAIRAHILIPIKSRKFVSRRQFVPLSQYLVTNRHPMGSHNI